MRYLEIQKLEISSLLMHAGVSDSQRCVEFGRIIPSGIIVTQAQDLLENEGFLR